MKVRQEKEIHHRRIDEGRRPKTKNKLATIGMSGESRNKEPPTDALTLASITINYIYTVL